MADKSKKLTILIAEDEPSLNNALFLKFDTVQGHQVYLAHDGKEALEKYKKYKPDVVILDLFMPHLSGAEFIEKVRPSKSRIIVLSNLDLEVQKDMTKEQADEYFIKADTDLAKLVKAVEDGET